MLKFSQIYCVIKTSELDRHRRLALSVDNIKRLTRFRQKQLIESHENQIRFIENVRAFTKRIGLNVEYLPEEEMERIKPGKEDLILCCGGDGTFLSCAQKYQESVLLGMNSDFKPKYGLGSHGALTSANRLNFKKRLECLKEGNFVVDKWKRLQAKVNGRLIERYAVNDIYFGQKISYETCDFHIRYLGQKQDFSCSGLLCCTGMGSHAWYYNAGGSSFSNELDAFGFKVLFPNLKRILKFSSGVVSSRYELIATPERNNCILSYDSKPDVIETQLGDEIRISLASNKPVRVVMFDDDGQFQKLPNTSGPFAIET